MEKETGASKQVESDVWNAIAAFEQILEAIPNDRVALETLYEAYEQIGDKSRSLEYLTALAQTIAEEEDLEAAPDIINKLNAHAADTPAVKPALRQLERLLVQNKMPSSADSSETSKRKTIDITNELALAWNLLQAGEFTQEEYSNVVHDLSENSSKNIQVPISVLHVLHDRSFKGMDRILKFLSKDSGLPLINLTGFEPPKEVMAILPRPFLVHRGAIAFELMGADALIAILNPYDGVLQADVKRAAGRACHFYLVNAADYDIVLDRIKKAQDKASP